MILNIKYIQYIYIYICYRTHLHHQASIVCLLNRRLEPSPSGLELLFQHAQRRVQSFTPLRLKRLVRNLWSSVYTFKGGSILEICGPQCCYFQVASAQISVKTQAPVLQRLQQQLESVAQNWGQAGIFQSKLVGWPTFFKMDHKFDLLIIKFQFDPEEVQRKITGQAFGLSAL